MIGIRLGLLVLLSTASCHAKKAERSSASAPSADAAAGAATAPMSPALEPHEQLRQWEAELGDREAQLRSRGVIVPPAGGRKTPTTPPVDVHDPPTREPNKPAAPPAAPQAGPKAEKKVEARDEDAIAAAASCPTICELAITICGLRDRICDLADAHEHEDEFVDACDRAEVDCAAAETACDHCSPT